MTQLALIKDGIILDTLVEGRGFNLSDGSRVSPAVDGWTDGVHTLKVVRTPTVPTGKRLTTDVKLVAGKPTWVLEDKPAIPRRTSGTFREFMDLFTPGEQLTIATAAQQNAQIKLWYDRAMGGEVPLDHADTIAGLGALVAGNLITQATADAVLAADYNEGKTTRVDS